MHAFEVSTEVLEVGLTFPTQGHLKIFKLQLQRKPCANVAVTEANAADLPTVRRTCYR